MLLSVRLLPKSRLTPFTTSYKGLASLLKELPRHVAGLLLLPLTPLAPGRSDVTSTPVCSQDILQPTCQTLNFTPLQVGSTSGLSVRLRDIHRVNAANIYGYYFEVAPSDTYMRWSSVGNRLYEIQSGNDDTGLKSNTDSKVLPATWHLSIDKDGNLFDPWTLWKYVGFELSDVEIVTGKKGAKPWMLSFRRRGAKFVKEEQAAEDNYKQRVSFAKRLMQVSTPLPPPALPTIILTVARRRVSATSSDGAGRPAKTRISSAASLASSSSGSSIGKSDRAPKTLVKVNPVASTPLVKLMGPAPKRGPGPRDS